MVFKQSAAKDIGLIGLGVMGQNLSVNIARNGYGVVLFDREPAVIEEFAARTINNNITTAQTQQELVSLLERPRKILLLVKAGEPVDWTINQIKPFLEQGDIVIDGGNSHFSDTERRQRDLKTAGIFLIGSGVSGGEKGALLGPSLMPGGEREAYEQVRPIWEAIAAKVDDGPCVTYIGTGGAGHFVKMVHNGIEYAYMQLIAEVYGIMRDDFQMKANQIADVFSEWRNSELESFLVDITARILRVKDPESNLPLIDLIVDQADQKGTGKWTSQVALDLGVPIPTIDAAITARNISARKVERLELSKRINAKNSQRFAEISNQFRDSLKQSLYAAKVCAFAQGMALIKEGSDAFGWNINLSEVARIWQGGCIIRASLLKKIKEIYQLTPELRNLLGSTAISSSIEQAENNWRTVVSLAVQQGTPVLGLSASLGYFDMYRSANLPLNLTQAHRDFFGSHSYRRVDKPELGPVHTAWED